MRKLWILAVTIQCVIFTGLYATYAQAQETIQVEMLNKLEKEKMIFNPTIIEVEVGDTVEWIAKSKGHNVQFVVAPQDIKFKSKVSRDTEYNFTESGIYLYVCTPHKGMGMYGVVMVKRDGLYDLTNLEEVEKSFKKGSKKTKKRLSAIKDEIYTLIEKK